MPGVRIEVRDFGSDSDSDSDSDSESHCGSPARQDPAQPSGVRYSIFSFGRLRYSIDIAIPKSVTSAPIQRSAGPAEVPQRH